MSLLVGFKRQLIGEIYEEATRRYSITTRLLAPYKKKIYIRHNNIDDDDEDEYLTPRSQSHNIIFRPATTRQNREDNMARKSPNIVITGTPGVGKTTHAEQLAQATGLKHLSVNTIVKDEGFHEGKDEETGSWIVDEDKVRC